jgi:autophagy-related protein 27
VLTWSSHPKVCGFRYTSYLDESEKLGYAFPIAGLEHLGHGAKDAEITRLQKQDPDREGLLVKLYGGEYLEDHNNSKKATAAVIEFQCDPDRSGLEGLEALQEVNLDSDSQRRRRRETVPTGDDQGDDKDSGGGADDSQSLRFKSFKLVDDTYILRLDWKTRYSCDNYVKDRDEASNGHWGFFTWLIIMYVVPIPFLPDYAVLFLSGGKERRVH